MHACRDETVLASAGVLAVAALLAVLQAQLPALAALVLERTVLAFEAAYAQPPSTGSNKQCGNLVLLLAQLYNLQVVHCGLLYDLVRRLAQASGARELDLMLVLLQHCGLKLRQDDPRALQEMVKLIEASKAASLAQENKETSTGRAEFVLQLIKDLKHNRQRAGGDGVLAQFQARLGPMQRALAQAKQAQTLGKKASKAKQSAASAQDCALRVRWDELVQADTRGRWWLVGGAWKQQATDNNQSVASFSAAASAAHASASSAAAVPPAGQQSDLLRLARENHMNSDVRRAVFCVVMAAQDYLQAYERLAKLNLRRSQAQEAVRVALLCCLREDSFNPYYGALLLRLCRLGLDGSVNGSKQARFTLQCALFEQFAALRMGEQDQASAYKLAELLRFLIVRKGVSLRVLKAIKFAGLELEGRLAARLDEDETADGRRLTLMFLYSLLGSLLSKAKKREAVTTCFSIPDKDGEVLRQDLSAFLDRHRATLRTLSQQGQAAGAKPEQKEWDARFGLARQALTRAAAPAKEDT
eukprot:g8192.t1